MTSDSESNIVIVFNIPENFGSADLRRFFSDFVESEKISCFHFKRRPEPKLQNFDRQKLLKVKPDSEEGSSSSAAKFNCCPVKLEPKYASRFVARYNNTHWTDEKGVDLNYKCFITPGSEESYWKGLEESNPPSVLPRGNVGTCTKFLLESIQSCKLPPTIIKRLKLNFHEKRRRAYATVPLAYQEPKSHKSYYVPSANTESKLGPSSSATCDHRAGKHEPQNCDSEHRAAKDQPQNCDRNEDRVTIEEEDGENEKDPDSENETEEWDRHRTLYNDVSARRQIVNPDDLEFQEMTKERRYEDRMEVTWDKGSSGLVFWTDEQFWRETGHGDSDEADDWDVDMEGYEVEGGGDLDNRAAMDMHYNDDVREGRVATSAFKRKKKTSKCRIGDFEKHTLGVGRKLMEKQGWKDGSGLGSKLAGISQPVIASGSSNRTGLGYKGEPLPIYKERKKKAHDCKPSATKSGRTFHISTIFDKKECDE